MPSFSPTPRPTNSIWGRPDYAEQILIGIWDIATPSHGGMILSEERQQAMPDALRLDEPNYEEDVDWSLVVLGFEAEFASLNQTGAKARVQLAHDFVRNWHPDRYEKLTGKPVELRDSNVRRQRQAYEALIGQLVVTSAFGSWADWVPDGKVGVVGRVIEKVDHLGRATYTGEPIRALVDKDRYDNGRTVNSFAAIGAEIIGDTPDGTDIIGDA
jgi:hypothetical protein